MLKEMSLILVNNTLIASFVVFMVILIFKLRNTEKAYNLPNIMVSLGILGTFTGIIIALLKFNVSDIQGSIPGFLEGLKTAFITSAVGMSLSILMKMYPKIIMSKEFIEKDENREVTIETLANIMKRSNENIEKSNQNNTTLLTKLISALTGDGESTILTQIQKLRTTTSDKLDSLQSSLENFAEKVSDLGSKALIEALSEVIKDFNTKLTEQFGNNFKQLNEGVGKMIEWQQEYKNHIDTMTAQFSIATDGITKSESSLEKITMHSRDIFEIIHALKPLLEEINSQREELKQSLNSFSDMSDKAKEAFPVIQKNMNLLMENISNNLNEFSIIQKESLKKTTDEMFKIVNNIESKIQSTINSQYDVLKQQLEKFDNALGDSLNKSLDSLGRAMASLSGKFLEDYSPLTEKLRQVVKISEGINGTRIAS